MIERLRHPRVAPDAYAVNGWNRLSIAFRSKVGGSQPKPRAAVP